MLENLSKEQKLIILGLVLVIVAGLGVMAFRHFAEDGPEEILIEEPESQGKVQIERAGQILVHVAGAVKQEGVYSLKFGDRIIDVLELAGGATASANLSSINLAQKIKDGQKVLVPVKRKVLERVSRTSSGKVSINTATEKELCKVKGVGKTTAKRIVEYRKTNGAFSIIEDVMKVKGIGKGKFGKIKDEIII
ncbi:MAG: helix-hairpin-helix domain-containing protein [Candidatus Margulisiibacteriota bacterium]